MASVNSSKEQRREQAEKDVKSKKRLEDNFVGDLNTFFEQLARDFRLLYASSGKVITLNDTYSQEMDSLLKKNYRSIGSEFDSKTRELIAKTIDHEKYEANQDNQDVLDNKIKFLLFAFMLQRSKAMTPKIISTAQEAIVTKVSNYITDKAKLGMIASQTQIANDVSKQIELWGRKHSPVIAVTETQTVSETAKFVENMKINEIVKASATGTEAGNIQLGVVKFWVTAGDEKVRESHGVIDGQSVKENESFRTGNGNMMRYCGDMSQGASLDDVINCRCSTIYYFNSAVMKIVSNFMYSKRKA